MVLMSVSALPASSDDNIQAQVLGDKKSELKNQAQTVKDSNLNEREKRRVTSEINSKISQTNQEIRHKQLSSALKKHTENERAAQSQIKNAEEKKEVYNSEDAKKAEEQSLQKHKRLDIQALRDYSLNAFKIYSDFILIVIIYVWRRLLI